ncbi:MAG: hypothetical protein WC198_08685, partial [Victivallaceae bacterium]
LGVLEFNISEPFLKLALNGSSGVSQIALPAQVGPDYLDDFIEAINGKNVELNNDAVINAARRTLIIQQAADQKLYSVQL